MPRVDTVWLEANADDILTVGAAPRIELFRVSTYTTNAEPTVVNTLLVAEKGGIQAGDSLWVGTNVLVVVSSVVGNATGAGTINLTSFIAYNNNDPVLLAKRGVTADNKTIYDDPDHVTSITQPFAADSNNNFAFYVEPGEYGIRYSDPDNVTLRVQNAVRFAERESRVVSLAAGSESYGNVEAFRRLPSTGGIVEVPGGTYVFSAVFTMNKSFMTFRGAGVGRTIWQFAGTATGLMVNCSSVNHVVFEDIEFDGNSVALAGVMMAVTSSTFVWFRRCRFKNSANHCTRLSSASANVYFDDCEFSGWGTAGASVHGVFADVGCSRVWVRDSYFHDATLVGASGTAIFAGDTTTGTVNDIYARGNVIETIGVAGTTGRGIVVVGATAGRDISITQNTIRNCGVYGILLRNMDAVTIADNPGIFECNSGIVLQACRRATVHHNSLHRSTTSGIVLESLSNTFTPNPIEDNEVSHNIFTDTDPAGATAASGSIRVVATDAADTRTHRRIHISNNLVEHNSTSMGAYGIRFQGQAASPFEDISINDNYIERCANTGIILDRVTGGTILGNTSKGNATDSFTFIASTVDDLTIGPNDFDDVSLTDGNSTLNGTTAVTIATKAAHTGMKVALTRTAADGGGNNGFIYAENVVDNVGFDVKSTDALDNVTFDWAVTA